jgi:signal transduction histidine kinase
MELAKVKKGISRHFSLRVRVTLLLTALVFTTIAGGIITIWYADTIGTLFNSIIKQDILLFESAEDLETTLAMQKGLTSYYFQDQDPEWLRQLAHYQKLFEDNLREAREQSRQQAAWAILSKIESEYLKNKATRQEVIRLYQGGDKSSGLKLLHEVRREFLVIHELCEQLKELYRRKMLQAQEELQSRNRHIHAAALIAIQVAAMTGALLAIILFKQILGPIRQLTRDTVPEENRAPISNEVRFLSRRVHSLIEDVDQTQNALARSQEHLVQAEKWAMTGKLAAGVAHSIRNPLTSVKIRLFSLGRAVASSPTLKEDFEVISEEIDHIESIVRSFLEFSRPPKLTMQRVSPSDVVDTALRLLQHRLESDEVRIEIVRRQPLPVISADPDQLKEVLVNLLVNACEMMVNGGFIRIVESEIENGEGALSHAVQIAITDNGPGIPAAIQENIFQPFFSTKEEGTGLGLSIASRIVENHGGRLTLQSQEGKGATFIITLPCPRKDQPSL